MKKSIKTLLIMSALTYSFAAFAHEGREDKSEDQGKSSHEHHGMMGHMESMMDMMQEMHENMGEMMENMSDPKMKKQMEKMHKNMGKMMKEMHGCMMGGKSHMESVPGGMMKGMEKPEMMEEPKKEN